MVIILTCSCGKNLQIGEDHAGERGLCPLCGNYLAIPLSADAAPPLNLAPGEIPVPLLLAAPEKGPPAPETANVASVEPAVEPPPPKEPELAPNPALQPVLSLELEALVPASPAAPLTLSSSAIAAEDSPPADARAETVLVPPLPLSTLLPSADEAENLDFVDRQAATRPRYGVFPPGAVFLAALLSGCLGAALVLAYNYQSLRRRRAMRLTGAVGIVSFLAFLAAICVWPRILDVAWLRLTLFAVMAPLWVVLSPSFPIVEKPAGLLPALVLFGVAWLLQSRPYYDHLRQGGRPASVWNAVAMSVFCAVFAFTGIGLHHALFLQRATPARALVVGSYPREVRVFYQPDVPDTAAGRLGEILRRLGPNDAGGTTVYVSSTAFRNGRGYTLSFVLSEDQWDDPNITEKLHRIGMVLADDGWLVAVELCNPNQTPPANPMNAEKGTQLVFRGECECLDAVSTAENELRPFSASGE